MIGVGGNALILRPQIRDSNRELITHMNELCTDLKELMRESTTDIRTQCDSTRAEVKDAFAAERREIREERRRQGRLLRAIIYQKSRALDGESVIQRRDHQAKR